MDATKGLEEQPKTSINDLTQEGTYTPAANVFTRKPFSGHFGIGIRSWMGTWVPKCFRQASMFAPQAEIFPLQQSKILSLCSSITGGLCLESRPVQSHREGLTLNRGDAHAREMEKLEKERVENLCRTRPSRIGRPFSLVLFTSEVNVAIALLACIL